MLQAVAQKARINYKLCCILMWCHRSTNQVTLVFALLCISLLFMLAGQGYSKYRLTVTTNAGAAYWCIEEWSFYDSQGARISTVPERGSASSHYSDSFGAGKAFNEQTHDDESYYCSENGVPTGWLQYDFGNRVVLSQYRLERLNGNGNQFSPVVWTLKASNDGNNWILIDTQSSQNVWSDGEVRTFWLTSSGVYVLGCHLFPQ